MMSGSVGKMIVATTALDLIEEGRLALDDPIGKWLGEEPWLARLRGSDAMTVRQLLAHTSGIHEHVRMPEFHAALRADPQKAWTPPELIEFALDRDPLFDPGTGWSYADTNYIVLGAILERAAEAPFYELARARVLEPFGMKSTIASDRPELPGLVSGYTGLSAAFPVEPAVMRDGKYTMNPQFEWTGGGYVTTSSDLARFLFQLFEGNRLDASSLAAMQVRTETTLGPGVDYGLGTMLWDSPIGEAVGHLGIFPGYLTACAYYPDYHVALAVQQNTDVGTGNAQLIALLDRLASALVR